jgi:hypothetical protein
MAAARMSMGMPAPLELTVLPFSRKTFIVLARVAEDGTETPEVAVRTFLHPRSWRRDLTELWNALAAAGVQATSPPPVA